MLLRDFGYILDLLGLLAGYVVGVVTLLILLAIRLVYVDDHDLSFELTFLESGVFLLPGLFALPVRLRLRRVASEAIDLLGRVEPPAPLATFRVGSVGHLQPVF